MKEVKYAVGQEYKRKRYPKAPTLTIYRIDDLHITTNIAGDVVKIEYIVSHEFMGQRIQESVCAVTIAKALWRDY